MLPAARALGSLTAFSVGAAQHLLTKLVPGQYAALSTAEQPHHPPRRALLYVPGHDERKIKKAATELLVDSICMDIEDGVALNMKDTARGNIIRMLDEVDFGGSDVAVRINPVSSGLASHDLQAVLSAERLPDTLVVPKLDSLPEVQWLREELRHILRNRGREGRRLGLITMCESAMGLLDLRNILEAVKAGDAPWELQGCILGGDDMAASIGATRTDSNFELQYCRQRFIMHCRAFHIQAIDIVRIGFKDLEGLRWEAKEGAQMGFTGKQVIHPAQVDPVQAAFTPSAEAIEAAQRLMDAFESHQKSGKGAFVHDDKMIDAPTMLQARNLLTLAARLEVGRRHAARGHGKDMG